jgi:hypothetical protein
MCDICPQKTQCIISHDATHVNPYRVTARHQNLTQAHLQRRQNDRGLSWSNRSYHEQSHHPGLLFCMPTLFMPKAMAYQ